jgi:hypothetical protein
VTQRILAYYEQRPAENVPAAQAARDLALDGKVLASILSRLAREGSVTRIARGVYRASTPARAVPDLRDLARDLLRTLQRTFGEDALDRMELQLPEKPGVEELRVFHARLARYLGRPAADDLLAKVALGSLGSEGSAALLRRVAPEA